MSTIQLRRKAKKQLDALPSDQLRSAADFIAFLGKSDGAKSSSTDPRAARLRERIRQADAAEAAGRLIPLEKLRRKR